jgi:putative 4-mercaptohistidine N1-methyltranferase
MPDYYESDRLLAEYLLFHYGSATEILPPKAPAGMIDALDFAVRTVSDLPGTPSGRALDLGCAVGRSSYELSRTFTEVVGVDFSRRFIDAAAALRHGPISYLRHDEAHLSTPLEAALPAGVRPERVRFFRGDAMDLPDALADFDLVHAANLLCRLREPRKLLHRLPSMVRPGGLLVLVTPCTWLESFTPEENWPKGSTLDWLTSGLSESFQLETTREEPFLIRETARKFQWTTSLLSCWKRLDAST